MGIYVFDVEKLMRDIRASFENTPTQEQISDQSGVSVVTLVCMDAGDLPSMEVFVKLCNAFDFYSGDYFVMKGANS